MSADADAGDGAGVENGDVWQKYFLDMAKRQGFLNRKTGLRSSTTEPFEWV